MVVQKFGGTSVADPAAIRRLIEIVAYGARAATARGPAVVVSAMSGVTDALLGVAADAGSARDRRGADAASRSCASATWLRPRELAPGAEHAALAAHIDEQFDQLAAVVRALGVLREVSPRTLDVVAAMGELLSSRLVAAALVACRRPRPSGSTRAAPWSPTTITRGRRR